jgi:hypothetical protein
MNRGHLTTPPDCAVISLRSIVVDGAPILYVTHDEDDHGWQFLDGNDIDFANAAVVMLRNIVKRDPTVLELADMPPGWEARRKSVGSPWRREYVGAKPE